MERSVLLRQPAACLNPAQGNDDVTIGQALFNAPDLLGGQAQRAAVSCASCHSNGRRNPAFFLDGISSTPGTADVSSGFFSTGRANDLFDPKPIPDLALPGKIDRRPETGALEKFVRGLVVEEFAGKEPSASQLKALAAYVRSVGVCDGGATTPFNLSSDLALLRTSIVASALLSSRGDADGARIAAAAARHRLGLIDERYPDNPGAHRALLNASAGLARVQLEAASFNSWLQAFEHDVVPRLKRGERRSLYDPSTLDRWLAQR